MNDDGLGDLFIDDPGDESEDELLAPPIVIPMRTAAPAPAVSPTAPQPAAAAPAPAAAAPAAAAAAAAPAAASPVPTAPLKARVASAAPAPAAAASPRSREERVAAALDVLMASSPDIEAAALISMDGFPMASALPDGMQEDRVAAMSAAILALGERAAHELGRGGLSQVFIEGEQGYVLLMSAGGRAVLTVLASASAKLGLVLYDMRSSAEEIGAAIG